MRLLNTYACLACFLWLPFSACTPGQVRYINQLQGSWNIAHERVILINPDGTTETLEDRDDAGTLLLTAQGDNYFLNYSLTVVGSNFTWVDKSFTTDEKQKRVLFYNFYCEELFGCDMIATIEERANNRQVWSFFRRAGSSSGGTIHRKTTWILERE